MRPSVQRARCRENESKQHGDERKASIATRLSVTSPQQANPKVPQQPHAKRDAQGDVLTAQTSQGKPFDN